MIRPFLLVVLLLAISFCVCAQPYYFTHYQVEHGLSNNAVTCSLLDKRGFMWFGTKDGLNRFDGYNFRVFRRDPKENGSLGNNFIYSLCENDDGNLWVGTDRGLYLYNYANESFTFQKNSPIVEIKCMVRDTYGNLWYIAGSDLYKLDRNDKTRSYAGQFLATALAANGASVWVGLSQGLLAKYDFHTDKFQVFEDRDNRGTAQKSRVEAIFSDNPGQIYFGTSNNGVKIFDAGNLSYSDVNLRNKIGQDIFVRAFVRKAPGELWIATESGIFIYFEKQNRYIQLKKQYNDPYSLSDNAIYTLCKDRDGGIFAGTYFGGINYYRTRYTPFEKFFPKMGENSISGNAVREMCSDKHGMLWIGTEDAGLNKFNPATESFVNYGPSDGRSGIVNSNIHGLLINDDELWIGTFEHGLDVMSLKTERVIRRYHATPDPFGLKTNFVYCMYKTVTKDLLIGTTKGLYVYNRAKDNFITLHQVPTDAFYTALTQDSRGNIWAGTFRQGVFVFRAAKDTLKAPPAINLSKLNTNRVTGILESSDKKMWITSESGLYCYSLSGQLLKHLTTNDGFPSDILYSLLEDKSGKLWISSSKGLICLDRSQMRLKVFTKADGLLTDQFNYNSAYKNASGRMFFGCVKGLISFDPTGFIKDKAVPPIYITGFQVNNRELVPAHSEPPLQQSIILTKDVDLNHLNSTFSIDFAALSFTSPGSTEYAYKMEGLDQQWTYVRKNRRAYFTELPPGDYVFKVKATNSILGWATGVTQLHIRIIPPFWKSNIAFMVYFVLIASLFYLAVRSYMQKLERLHQRRREVFENEKEKEIYQSKIDFFINIAHEIRTPLTLIRVPMEKLIKRASEFPDMEKSLQTMNRNTQRLLSLTNQLLDFRSTETHGFSLSFVKANVSELLRDIWGNFQPAAEQRKLKYRIILSNQPFFAYIDPEACTKIISNLLDNAIKYAKSEVIMELLIADELFKVEVSSDSKPLSPDQRLEIFEPFFRRGDEVGTSGTGLGLAIARGLAELHSGKLELANSKNGCNIFVLELPIHQLFEFNLEGKWKK